MRGALSLLMRGRLHAMLAAGGALMVPGMMFVSGALVALVALRVGARDATAVLAGALGIGGIAGVALYGSLVPTGVFAFGIALPVLLLAMALRFTSSQALCLTIAGAMAALWLCAVHLLADDPVEWWRGALETVIFSGRSALVASQHPDLHARFTELIDAMAPWAVSFPSDWAITLMVVLFIARWCHAVLDNPGGFGQEFRALRLDRRIAYLTIVLAAAALGAGGLANGLPVELFKLATTMYALQGLALAHAMAAARSAPVGWLVALYFLLVLLPLTRVLLSVAGFSDAWMDYRRRFGRA